MNKLLLIGGAAALAVTAFSFKKVTDYSDIIDQLEFKPLDISNIDVDFEKISFKLKMLINNPSHKNLNLDTLGAITLKELVINNSLGNQVARVFVNQSNINIPANGGYQTGWLPVSIPLANAASMLLGGFDFNYMAYDYKGVLTVPAVGNFVIG
ncbi:hypothetical protein [Nonlabens agnitus]|nr:hypothetical protein [Nonlabens agnitus]